VLPLRAVDEFDQTVIAVTHDPAARADRRPAPVGSGPACCVTAIRRHRSQSDSS
jgi:hypothetical protein